MVQYYFSRNIPNRLTNLTLKASYIGFVDNQIPRWVPRKEIVLPVEKSASIKQHKTSNYKRNRARSSYGRVETNIDMVNLFT